MIEPVAFARSITEAVAVAGEPRPTLQDVLEWIGRRADEHHDAVRSEALGRGAISREAAREVAVGRKAIDLMAKIIERQDEVLFLLRAKPRNERGRR